MVTALEVEVRGTPAPLEVEERGMPAGGWLGGSGGPSNTSLSFELSFPFDLETGITVEERLRKMPPRPFPDPFSFTGLLSLLPLPSFFPSLPLPSKLCSRESSSLEEGPRTRIGGSSGATSLTRVGENCLTESGTTSYMSSLALSWLADEGTGWLTESYPTVSYMLSR